MSLANDNDQPAEIELTYGELTLIRLEGFFGHDFSQPKPVPSEFWDWRKENKSRAGVLNKAGLVLRRNEDANGYAHWTADLSTVTADTLDNAVDAHRQWKRTEKELKERANLYLRQCDRMKYQPGGQFGGRCSTL